MNPTKAFGTSLLLVGAVSFASSAYGSEEPPLVGDPANGAKLYKKHCADCHGKDAKGGRTGSSLVRADRMTLIRDGQLLEIIQSGKGLKKAKDHRFARKVDFLSSWDIIQHLRSHHLQLHEFFPKASRYLAKEYEIDDFGLKRIKEATGKGLNDKEAAVFTFFDFDGEEGELKYVPQDPIKLDELKKDKKSGYLVFLELHTHGFDGEVGIAMDKDGVITKIAAHEGAKKADLINKDLSRFVGMGKKGLKEPFKIGGGKNLQSLAKDVFPLYLRAMETVTMYDREENERTWADME